MANNSNRKAIEFMVQGALPPHSTNVLWMDISVPTLPVLKIFENGAWTNVHTEDSKSIELLAETVLAQQNEITELTEDISSKMALDATVAKETTLQAVEQDASAAKIAAQALVPVAAAAEAYNTGKVQLAQNITSKGIEASATETLPELAEKVSAIVQESYTIDGGEMYAKQLFGGLTTLNYWNLYEVLENLLSDGRLVQYGGILLAEYYRGYDSLALAGAGAGGAYVVSDKDENGQFKMYTEDTTHTWATEFDGKSNRWVAYCFADEYHDFQITDTNTSPRSIFIGRKVGTITSLVDGRVSEIVVPDGNSVNSLQLDKKQNFNKNVCIRNIKELSGIVIYDNTDTEQLYVETETLKNGASLFVPISSPSALNSLILKINKIDIGNASLFTYNYNKLIPNLTTIIVQGVQECGGVLNFSNLTSGENSFINSTTLKCITFIDVEELYYFQCGITASRVPNLHSVYIGYKTNNKEKSVTIREYKTIGAHFTDVELQDGWCKPLNCNYLLKLTEANMYVHILQRLKQDEPDCGDGVTITLGETNLAKLTSAESVALLDSLTNVYGYTFA